MRWAPTDPSRSATKTSVNVLVEPVDGHQRKDIRDFLTSRRARMTPQQAGLPDYGAKRRVPGLRREEH